MRTPHRRQTSMYVESGQGLAVHLDYKGGPGKSVLNLSRFGTDSDSGLLIAQ
ncbi:hypothetical protein L917_02342 [Phytophthora nicotianae]|uniref:Uncharacterized protein n=1 Tax=Phytophthora nicotianae TaxID=4792 RepID=W2LU93_PHYNI|nr:hypothetical protein L917_02342 [Phytophthora nicotianae]ETM54191.1 hypothetical protein L914_02438 [Phytophthora nicotianae]